MATYQSFIDLADRLIRAKGAAITLTRVAASGNDPVAQTATYTPATHTFRGVGLPAGKSAEFRVGSLVNRNVYEFYLAQKSQTVEPQPGDVLAFKGANWTILAATTYDPAADGSIFTKAYAER